MLSYCINIASHLVQIFVIALVGSWEGTAAVHFGFLQERKDKESGRETG